MSTEPLLDPAELLAAVQARYGLDMRRATFLPVGTAPAYRLEGPAECTFAKVMPPTPYGERLTRRVLAEWPLLRALRETGTLCHVPALRPTVTGEALTWAADHRVVLYDWIEGNSLGADGETAGPEVAALLGRLHAGTPRLPGGEFLPQPPEAFLAPFVEALQRHLEPLWRGGAAARPGVRALGALLEPHRHDIEAMMDRTRRLAQAARAQPSSLVVCHTDAHGGNLMRDPQGQLWLIDWEMARLAPPEHDLWMLHARLPEVLPAYQAAAGKAFPASAGGLSLDRLGFYLCARPLEDLAEDVHSIVQEHSRAEQDEHSLEIISRYVLPALLRAQDDLEGLRRALA
ncbi:phosphotransferase [Deinococcus navajonensis]|uniref:Phosphotransferase n=1 Tax=Deinococcus navajonensis TaxID=309884 RepID=A0ABV8XP39_9DEIO